MPSCNQMLPAEDRYNLTFEPPRPPGPSGGRLAFNTLPMPTQPVEVKREPRHYTLDYYFDGMVNFKHRSSWRPCSTWRRAMPATRVEIVGYRSARAAVRWQRAAGTGRTSPGVVRNRWPNCCAVRD